MNEIRRGRMSKRRIDYEKLEAGKSGWSRWVTPMMSGYRMSCCDCGLVHVWQFRVCGRDVQFRVSLNKRATGQIRRGMAVRKAIDQSAAPVTPKDTR